MKKINIVGAGYVGLANGLNLACNNLVNFMDTDISRIQKLKNKVSPIIEEDLTLSLKKNFKNLTFYQDYQDLEGEYIFLLCLPTDFDDKSNRLDTTIIENEIQKILDCNHLNKIVIKSTVPIGFTSKMREKFPNSNIYFSPEFLREGSSLQDAAFPERVIIAPPDEFAAELLDIISSGPKKIDKDKKHIIGTSEAEAVKIFSNSYLALRVAFFNELDNYCLINNLNTGDIIAGVSKDSRIGDGYNNPSFGYGGYCLPKDTKQAEALYKTGTQKLFTATIQSNQDRIQFIAESILEKSKKNIGIYRLQMKANSDNLRLSSTVQLVNHLKNSSVTIYIYEPLYDDILFIEDSNIHFIEDIKTFERLSDLIVLNRLDTNYIFKKEIFTRDIFNEN